VAKEDMIRFWVAIH